MNMQLELNEKEKEILLNALKCYLGELREEIVKTESYKWKPPLHEEEEIIKNLIQKVST
jgi:hypothetical protein